MSQFFYVGPGSFLMIKKKLTFCYFFNYFFLDSIKSRLGPK